MNAFADHPDICQSLRIADEVDLRLDLRRELISKLPFLVEGHGAAEATGTAADGNEEEGYREYERLLQHRKPPRAA